MSVEGITPQRDSMLHFYRVSLRLAGTFWEDQQIYDRIILNYIGCNVKVQPLHGTSQEFEKNNGMSNQLLKI